MQRERLQYAIQREKATRDPSDFCSIIIDRADQATYGLPHLLYNTKSMRGDKLKVRMISVKDHDLVSSLFLYLMTEEFEKGATHIVEVLHRFLCQKASKGTLPSVLLVQADNCTRENKNRFVMAYFEMLVAMGVFRQVNVSFLPVGHTHEDIAQVFYLCAHEAVTQSDCFVSAKIKLAPEIF